MPISIWSAGRRWCCSGCSTAPFPALAENQLAAVHFALYNLGDIVFLIGIPLARARQTVGLAAGGSLLVLVGMLTLLANYFLNEFSQPSVPAREKV